MVGRSLRRDSYRLNPAPLLVPVIRDLFRAERSVPAELERELASAIRSVGGITEAHLFGSAARGNMRPDSDIDVAVRSERALPETVPAFEPLFPRFANRITLI